MRAIYVVLTLMVLAVFAGLSASRSHANVVPKCESRAMQEAEAKFGHVVTDIECTDSKVGGDPLKLCRMTAETDLGYTYFIAMSDLDLKAAPPKRANPFRRGRGVVTACTHIHGLDRVQIAATE
jgi:hypothetical protein